MYKNGVIIMNKRKRDVLKVASIVFAKYGYRGATMDEIALEAGIVKGTLYYNFKNKEEIFDEIIKSGIGHLREDVEKVRKMDIDIREKIKRAIKIQLEFFYENKEFFKVVLSQIWGEEPRQIKLREQIRKYIYDVKDIIDEAMKNSIAKEANSLLLAHAYFASITSTALYDLIEKDEEKDEAIEMMLEFTLRGLNIN